LRVGLYARVSTLDQNPDLQLRELREYARRRDWKITEFVDHGISGTETRRPRLAAMNEALFRHDFDAVLVWKFDRLFRSVQHIVEFFEKVRRLQIDFVSITEQIDTSTPTGKMIFTVLGAVAELERSLIAERVRAGLRNARAKGKRLGRPSKHVSAAQIAALRAQGVPWRRIGAQLGVSPATAYAASKGRL